MAKEFPHCDVVGVDISPTPVDPGGLPPNCHFEIDDITLGLPHFKDQFDIVHARFIGSGLRDFKQSQADIHQCLKPGGIIIWMDVDYDIYTTDVHTYFPIATDDNPDGTWLGRVIYGTFYSS
jgi:SAM-dependent methyltransferase